MANERDVPASPSWRWSRTSPIRMLKTLRVPGPVLRPHTMENGDVTWVRETTGPREIPDDVKRAEEGHVCLSCGRPHPNDDRHAKVQE